MTAGMCDPVTGDGASADAAALDSAPASEIVVPRTVLVRRLLFIALSLIGYGFAAIVGSWFVGTGRLLDPAGSDVGAVLVAAGEAFRAGRPVYSTTGMAFFYAPPIVLILAAFSLLPYAVCVGIVLAANAAALRFLAGSWQRVGYTFWFLPIAFLPWLGTLDLPMAAVIVLTVQRGYVALPVLFGFMKFGPLLAVDLAKWRRAAAIVALSCAVTLPVAWLWPQWITQLSWEAVKPVGPIVPIPFAIRLPVALMLVMSRRPVLRAIGAVVATPAFYWHSFALLLAPIAVWRGAAARSETRSLVPSVDRRRRLFTSRASTI